MQLRFDSAWRPYINIGMKYYSIPRHVFRDSEMLHQYASDLLLASYQGAIGILIEFSDGWNALEHLTLEVETLSGSDGGEQPEIGHLLESLERDARPVINSVERLKWAIGEAVATRNSLRSRGLLQETDDTRRALVEGLREWSENVAAFAEQLVREGYYDGPA